MSIGKIRVCKLRIMEGINLKRGSLRVILSSAVGISIYFKEKGIWVCRGEVDVGDLERTSQRPGGKL